MIDRSLQQQFYEMLEDSQWWPRREVEDYQNSQLVQLVQHARGKVDFYRSRLDMLFDVSGNLDLSRWLQVPIVKRRDLLDSRVAMQASDLPAGHGPVGTASSSGSTGLAITVTNTALQALADNAARWRVHKRMRLDWSANICSRQEVDRSKAPWPEGRLMGRWGPRWMMENTGRAWMIYKGTPAAETFEFIKRNDCAYLNVGAKTAHALALEAERLQLDLKLDAILAQGEGCDELDEVACLRAFGARIVEHYSSKEMGQGAHPCELGTLHVNEENVLLEILDEHDLPCSPGQTGRVVVTPFYSTAQPLIRYDQGDLARFGTPCACGRTSRTLQKIVGRVSAIFRHPDGRAVSRLLPKPARAALNCTMMQLAQTGPNSYEVRYVPAADESRPDETTFRRIFHEEYFDDAQLAFVRVGSIPPNPSSGKIADYVNEYVTPK